MSVILSLGRWRQDNQEFKDNLGYTKQTKNLEPE